nr:hypothetical protein [Tanacetum cinerariifolium]
LQPLNILVWKWDEISTRYSSAIVSDRDPRFTSRFWKGLQKAWGTRLKSFKTLCLLNYALMKCHDYDITVFFTKIDVIIMVLKPGFETVGSKDLTCEDWMVNTRTDVDLSAAVQNALQTLLPQIRAEIREEFRTSSGPSDAGGNPPPVTIHTWLEHFNKQKPWLTHVSTPTFLRPFRHLADIASPDSRRDSRGVPYQFWTVGC